MQGSLSKVSGFAFTACLIMLSPARFPVFRVQGQVSWVVSVQGLGFAVCEIRIVDSGSGFRVVFGLAFGIWGVGSNVLGKGNFKC